MTADTRPPLYLMPGEVANHFSLHPQDKGREVIVVDWQPAPATGPWPPRVALGWNSKHEWVWADEAEGRWP